MNILKYLTAFALLIIMNLGFASDPEQDFNLKEVSPGNFLHHGKHVSIDNVQHDDIANIGFIIGDRCIAVIDTGGSVNTGIKLLQRIRAVSDKPICYVINTHIHFDHLLGNKAFIVEKPEYVGHHHLAVEVEQNREFFLERFKDDLGPNPATTSVIGPDILIDETTTLDLGNRSLTLIAYPVSHSHSDLVVIDNKTGTLWAGDLIFRERIPSLTGNLIGWLKTIEELLGLTVKTVIPGHGTETNSIIDATEQLQGYLQRLLDETRLAIANGLFINEAIESVDKNNHSNWLLFEYQHPTNVSKAYTELEWE
jgi:quinoprotein relay system zinc metallohydrolase 2